MGATFIIGIAYQFSTPGVFLFRDGWLAWQAFCDAAIWGYPVTCRQGDRTVGYHPKHGLERSPLQAES